MGLPSKVDVLGKMYAVELSDSDADLGECIINQCLIRVQRKQCAQQKRDTILHELTHAIELELKLNLKESQVHRLATGMLAVLRHNPRLVAFLMEKDA